MITIFAHRNFNDLSINCIAETDKNVIEKEINISFIFVFYVRENLPFSTTANELMICFIETPFNQI